MSTFAIDFRQSLRGFMKSPGSLVAMTLSLALGIGACTALFSALRAAFVTPMPWRDADRLVLVFRKDAKYPMLPPRLDITAASVQLWREGQRTLESLSGFTALQASLSGPIEPRTVTACRADLDFFQTLGAHAEAGRLFGPGDSGVAVLSHRLWTGAFHADPGIIGKSVTVGGVPATVLGVLPPEAVWFGFDVFIPLVYTAEESASSSSFLLLAGRMKPGVTLQQVRQDLESLSRSLEARVSTQKGITAVPQALRDDLNRTYRDSQRLLALVGLFVLALACLNVATLILGRATGRLGELGLRQALGAGRSQLLAPLLAEAATAVLPGLVLGFLFARWTRDMLSVFVSSSMRAMQQTGLAELVFAAALALLVALVGAWIPALLLPRIQLGGVLGGTKTTEGPRRKWVRSGLVALQLALALVLLSGFALVSKSLRQLQKTDLGFDPEHSVVATLQLPSGDEDSSARSAAGVASALERIRALPGVRAAGATDIVPILTGGGNNGNLTVPGRAEPAFTYYREASEGYFQAMGIPLLKGRDFGPADMKQPPSTTVISASFARDYFPGQDPLGKTLKLGRTMEVGIVGVVGDVRMDGVEQSSDMQTLYVPGRPTQPQCDLVVRVQGRPETCLPAVREVLRSQWPQVPLDQMDSFRSRLARLSRNAATQATLLGLLAGLALLLAAAGVYGVLSRDVAERRREIGIRMALGGTAPRVALEILRYGAILVGVGLGLGALGVVASGRVMASLLYKVSPTDPVSLLLAALLLAAAALLATLIPALHAARVDPAVALRDE